MHHVRPAGQVDGGPDQGLVERDQGIAEPADPGLVAQRLAQRVAERDRRILHCVVRVDLDIAGGLDAQVDLPVLRELVQHVVEERHPSAHVGRAGAV